MPPEIAQRLAQVVAGGACRLAALARPEDVARQGVALRAHPLENVGGAVFEAVFPLLNPFARVPVCGLIAWYNATEPSPGPDRTPLILRQTLTRRLTIRGFIVRDFSPGDFLAEVGGWIRDGRLRYREDIREGLESAPAAFIGLLEGANFGKLLVRVAPDPTL